MVYNPLFSSSKCSLFRCAKIKKKNNSGAKRLTKILIRYQVWQKLKYDTAWKLFQQFLVCNMRERHMDGRTDRQVGVKSKQTAVLPGILISNGPEFTQISLNEHSWLSRSESDRSRRHLRCGRLPLTCADLPKRVYETRDTWLTAINCVGQENKLGIKTW